MQPDPCARWVSSLHCGHDARVPELGLPPRVGSFIACPDRCLGGPKRVDAVAAVPVVLVQDPLFDLEALT